MMGIWENKGDNFNDQVGTYIIEYWSLAIGEADIENGTELVATFEERFNIVSLRNEEDEPIFIEVYERDKNKNEEVWKDNFNVTSTHTIKRKP